MGYPADVKRPHPRSLALRAVGVVLLVALAPLAVVAVAAWTDLGGGDGLLRRVEGVAQDASSVLDDPRQLDQLARERKVRLRVLDAAAHVERDFDHQQGGLLRAVQGPLQLRADLRAFDDELGPILARPEFSEARQVGRASGCRATDRGEQLVCHGALRVGDRTVYVQDSGPLSVKALVDDLTLITRLTGLVLPVALLLALYLGWRTLAPIEELRRQLLQRADAAAPDARLDLQRGDELGDLAAAFDAVVSRLEQRERANEAFVADLVHELKNPVAAVRAAAEVLGGDAEVTPARARRLGRVLGESSVRLQDLLDHLLALARAESGLLHEEREELDLVPLMQAVVDAARLAWPQVELSLVVPSGARLRCVPGRLETALRNLVDNACSFAEGQVRVSLEIAAERLQVSVDDDGPGIPATEREVVFQRFYTSRAGQRGAGLGLALVKAVVEAHGGAVEVGEAPAGGARFVVLLPAA